jgi:hypothetical protein
LQTSEAPPAFNSQSVRSLCGKFIASQTTVVGKVCQHARVPLPTLPSALATKRPVHGELAVIAQAATAAGRDNSAWDNALSTRFAGDATHLAAASVMLKFAIACGRPRVKNSLLCIAVGIVSRGFPTIFLTRHQGQLYSHTALAVLRLCAGASQPVKRPRAPALGQISFGE